MTALVVSTDIPSNINTLEKLAAWVGLALEDVLKVIKGKIFCQSSHHNSEHGKVDKGLCRFRE